MDNAFPLLREGMAALDIQAVLMVRHGGVLPVLHDEAAQLPG